jgi:type I restriction enzyme S subunit
MKFGLQEKNIEAITAIFKKYSPIDSAVLYGSRAKGNFRPNSDIDLTLKGELDLTVLMKIETELDDLLLPYKIDLSIFHKLKNQDLIEHINRVGIEIYHK